MRVHFIAIGGSAMHNLAIALHKKGYEVTGSDDEIFEPSRSRLKGYGLLPTKFGWDVTNITEDLDAVILGMHARKDNPELHRAKELGIKIYSYPEYIYEQTKNKLRVVIGGSHGKTTITAMLLHVLKACEIECDYMVGAQLEGFDTMVNLTKENKIAVIEGDEYLSSPIDPRPKFHLYKPNVALISGIAWDHINVFPTFENYIAQFKEFIQLIEPNGTLVYYEGDAKLKALVENCTANIKKVPYLVPAHKINNGITSIVKENKEFAISVFGDHNLANMEGARLVAEELGVNESDFYSAIKDFKGASKRLELVKCNSSTSFFKDFAHSPSKLKATTKAVKEQFKNRKLVACMELHTFSSLNKRFLNEYRNCMEQADEAIVYFNPDTIAHKKLEPITIDEVKESFGGENLRVFTNSKEVISFLKGHKWTDQNLLMMTSGNFDGVDFHELADELIP